MHNKTKEPITKDFGNGVVASVTFHPGEIRPFVEWTGTPTVGIMQEYKDWILLVMQRIVDDSGLSIIYAVLPFGIWKLTPFRKPRLIRDRDHSQN